MKAGAGDPQLTLWPNAVGNPPTLQSLHVFIVKNEEYLQLMKIKYNIGRMVTKEEDLVYGCGVLAAT